MKTPSISRKKATQATKTKTRTLSRRTSSSRKTRSRLAILGKSLMTSKKLYMLDMESIINILIIPLMCLPLSFVKFLVRWFAVGISVIGTIVVVISAYQLSINDLVTNPISIF